MNELYVPTAVGHITRELATWIIVSTANFIYFIFLARGHFIFLTQGHFIFLTWSILFDRSYFIWLIIFYLIGRVSTFRLDNISSFWLETSHLFDSRHFMFMARDILCLWLETSHVFGSRHFIFLAWGYFIFLTRSEAFQRFNSKHFYLRYFRIFFIVRRF